MQNIKFTDVKITDDFWSGRQKQSLIVGIEACANNLKSSIENFENDAKVVAGDDYTKYEMHSNFAADSDVYKLIEGMAYAYANYKDSTDTDEKAAVQKISNYFNEWIPKIAAAQFEDGYLNSLFTLHNEFGGGAGGTETGLTKSDRFKILGWHEFYCSGHLYEAAIAVYNATGDTRLLEISVKNFDLLYDIFINKNTSTYDPGDWTEPGHEEIELALIKLATVFEGVEKYGKEYADKCIEFSQMVMDKSRVLHEDSKGGEINESELKTLPLSELTEAWGHCVRAFYRYTGMTDMNLYKKEMVYKNLETLWNNVETKTYVTGGIGNDRYTEGFAASYDLDNDHSYCETCSSISNVFWNNSMNLLYGNSKYYDNIEKQLYNNVISGIGLEGDTFYYQNRLTNAGGVSRPNWYGTPCCPTNLMRLIQKLGEYIYTYDSNTLAVNMYIGNSANLKIGNNTVGVNMTSSMPWEGNVALTLNPENSCEFTLKLRMPSWATEKNILKINGISENITVDDGYIEITRVWKKSDKIELELPMSVELVDNSDKVLTSEGLVAVKRGPVVYAVEQIDNEEDYNNYCVNESSTFETEKTDSFIEDNTYNTATLQLLKVNAQTLDDCFAGNGLRTTLKMIPFYAWANRGLTPMKVYVSNGQMDTR